MKVIFRRLLIGPPQFSIFDEIKVKNRRTILLTLGVICCIVFGNRNENYNDLFIEDYKEELRLIKAYKDKQNKRNKDIESFYLDREITIQKLLLN